MEIELKDTSETEKELIITASPEQLEAAKAATFDRLRGQVDASGFRQGKAPDNIIEKELGAERVQEEFLQTAVSECFQRAVDERQLKPLQQPQIEIQQFVPYKELKFTASFGVVPDVDLPDYTAIRKEPQEVSVDEDEIQAVLETVQRRLADREQVDRPAQKGDEVVIDFAGKKDGEILQNASSTDYTLQLGSQQFIPGFEEAIVGMEPGQEKEFEVTFPQDYNETSLAGQEVTFEVTLKQVTELDLPEINDDLAEKAGPFQNLDELKDSVKNSLQREKNQQDRSQLENDLINEVVEASEAPLPPKLVEQQKEQLIAKLKQDLSYRDKTFEEYLEEEDLSEEELHKDMQPEAEKRVKTALVLTEIADREGLSVSEEDLEVRLQLLKGKYKDEDMQKELDTPQAQRQIANRLLTEKTVDRLIDYATDNVDDEDSDQALDEEE